MKDTNQGLKEIIFRIYYIDTDAGGVVYYANYLHYFEKGRMEYMRGLGYNLAELAEQGYTFVVTKAEVKYNAPAKLDDLIRVYSEITEVKNASLVFKSKIFNHETDQLLTSAKITLACVGTDLSVQRIPEHVLEKLQQSQT